MKEVVYYQCDFCNKAYKRKSSAKTHEAKCFYNPKSKSCATCLNNRTIERVDFNCQHKLSDKPTTGCEGYVNNPEVGYEYTTLDYNREAN